MLPKMLVTRIGAFGDVCMLIPVVKALSRHFQVDWLVRPQYVPVIRSFPDVHCRTIEAAPSAHAPFPFTDRLVEQLRAEKYDYCLDFSHWDSIRRLIARLHEIPIRAVTCDPRQDELLQVEPRSNDGLQPFNKVVAVDADAHQVSKWLQLIQESTGVKPALEWPLPDARAPDDVLRIFVHAHASKANKLWPIGYFSSVLRELAGRRRVHVVVNATQGIRARALRWRLLFSRCTTEIVRFDRTFTVLRHAIQNSDIVMGCDSGPMHYASLLGTPTFVVYGPYSPREFCPLWRSVSIAPERDGDSASAVNPSRVVDAIESYLEVVTAKLATVGIA